MDLNKSIECENCGGTDFTTEGGFYFCTECQTQSQEIQERYFDQNDTVHVVGKKITVRKDPVVSLQSKLTSWETYNLILYGLVQELQNLGADDNFKDVCYHLWLQYLTKLEYINEKSNVPPKLGASYKRRDAEIVYQRKFTRKRKRSTTSNMSVGEMDERMKHKEKIKQRRQMERSEYESISQSRNSESLSAANQTLSGLSSDDETSSIAGQIDFNKSSKKELLRHMTSHHLKLHMQDINNEMRCHKSSRKFIKGDFFRGPNNLTRNKLYCVLYLAILLTQQEIQISDIIRYCREGHLSFLDYTHFFSDLVDLSVVDHTVYTAGRKQIPSYEFMRNFSFELYQFLEIRPCEFSPNILRLCRRYCTELNLPDQIYNIAGDYIYRTRPFQSLLQPKCIPNYEGRAMGFIIYVLKVLFGFDDVTEHELSKFAKLVNKKNAENAENDTKNQPELFNFTDWFHYLEYRQTVLKYVHFPTWYLLHPDEKCPLDLFTKFVYDKKDICDKEPELIMSIAKKFLNEIEIDHGEEIKFEPSVTPCRSKLEKLKTIENFEILDKQLNLSIIKDASKHTIKYLIEPHDYLKQIKAKKCSIIFNNAHPEHKLKRINAYVGDFFEKTLSHWIQKWDTDFAKLKTEHLALDQLMGKILNKHLQNIKSGQVVKPCEPKVLYAPKDKHIESIKKSVGRDKNGRFCKKNDPKALSPDKIKPTSKKEWHVSSWNRTCLKAEYNPSLLHQVKTEEELKKEHFDEIVNKEKKINSDHKYRYHYIPRMEYCSNIRDVTYMSKENFKEFEKTLPKNFQWLLQQCARVIEQPTKDLYEEFVNVEVYMNYIYFKRQPVVSKPLSNNKAINRLIKDVTKNW